MITTRPGKIIPRPLRFPKTKLYTKFEVPSSSSLWRYVRLYAKNLGPHDLSHAPFGESYLCIWSAFHMQSNGPNLKSLALIDLNIILIFCQKFYGSRDLGNAPLRVKLFVRLIGFLKTKLSTKFKVHSSSSFQDIFHRMPKILGSRDLRHTPFGENYPRARSALPRRSCIPNLKSLAQVMLKICYIVCQKF